MMETLFTLDDANRILPLVRSITRDAVHRYRAAKGAIHKLGQLKADRLSGLEVDEDAIRRQDSVIERHLYELRRLIDELEALGCRLRDYEKGVVDFPAASMDADQFIFYCWILGEPDVSHWHSEEEGYDQRRLIGAEAST
jgi:hypothetical protein